MINSVGRRAEKKVRRKRINFKERTMAKKHKNIEELRIAIIVRAWKDPEFKAKLLKNPRAAFAEMDAELPREIDVRVIEEKAGTVTFVLPQAVSNVGEMSDRELQKLAGGNCGGSNAGMRQMTQQAQGSGNRAACQRALGSSGPGEE